MKILNFALLLTTLILLGCKQTPEDSGRPDKTADRFKSFGADSPAETPQEAMQIYFQSMADGDLKAMKAVVIPFDQIDELFTVQIRVNKAMDELNQSGAKRFPERSSMFSKPTAAEQQLALAQSVEVIVDDTTHAHCQLSLSGPPLRMLTEGNGWKIDLAAGPQFLDSIPMQLQAFGDTAQVFEGVTLEIEKGTIQSVEQLQDEMKKRTEAFNL